MSEFTGYMSKSPDHGTWAGALAEQLRIANLRIAQLEGDLRKSTESHAPVEVTEERVEIAMKRYAAAILEPGWNPRVGMRAALVAALGRRDGEATKP